MTQKGYTLKLTAFVPVNMDDLTAPAAAAAKIEAATKALTDAGLLDVSAAHKFGARKTGGAACSGDC